MADNYKLFDEFPPIPATVWKEKIISDLKGADFDRRLVWRTNEGFSVQPYYRREDLDELGFLNALPGEFPYVRGTRKKDNDWLVRQDIVVKNIEEANKKALDILMKGTTSLGFVLSECRNWTTQDMQVLLGDICLDAVEVNFAGRCHYADLVEIFVRHALSGNWIPENVTASIEYDPLGNYLLLGRLCEGCDTITETAVKMIRDTAALPDLRVLAVNGKHYGNAGASVTQELAFSLAQGAEYLTALTEAGLTADEAARNIKFNLSIGPNYFMEIAGFRAGRLLWAGVVESFGPSCKRTGRMVVHAETGSWNKTFYDPYVNMLRTQTETMSAALGGVHSISVLPFNAVFEQTTLFSERIARNQQLLLKEESHFNKIADPAAGSYYIEELTASVAEEAWKLFLQIQDRGGFLAAAKEGFIQTLIRETAARRDRDLATRRENLLGTNQFPNFTEKYDLSGFDASAFEPVDMTVENADIETIRRYRGAQSFEKLRAATDRHARENKRPLVFMLTIGNLAMRKARAQFACNFFAIAGYEVLDHNGFGTVGEGMAAAREAGADIVVLCSSDEEYEELAPQAFLLAGDTIFVVAGAPACMDELKNKGIKNFIHVKSNLLEDLEYYQKELKISDGR